MSTAVAVSTAVMSDAEIALSFERILPELTSRIAACAAHAPDPEEAAAEMAAHAWRNYRQAARSGRELAPGLLAWAAYSWVKGGRSMTGDSCRDVHAVQCQRRGRARVIHLSALLKRRRREDYRAVSDEQFTRCIAYEHRDPAKEAAARLDWQALYRTLSRRLQRVLHGLAVGDRTSALAQRLRVSQGRASQLKTELGGRVLEFFGPALS